MIDWNSVIAEIAGKEGQIIDYNTSWKSDNPAYQDIYKILSDAKVDFKTAQWINYYPGKDFSESVVTEFEELVGCKVIRAWISKVTPGHYVPYHWDVDDNESEYLKLGTLKRFSCFITDPVVGQIIMVGDEYLYAKPKGTVYQWPDYKAWHAGTNASLKPKFLFNFLGY